VAQILLREQVELIFCYPSNTIIEACAEAGIRPVISRTERTLINMADGYSRVHNGQKLSVACVQYGPGAENAVAGVAQAYADGSPILVLLGSLGQHRLGLPGQLDVLRIYAHISRMCERVNQPERIPEMLRRALTVLRSPKTGPVVLELPDDVLRANVNFSPESFKSPTRLRSAGDPAAIESTVETIRSAKRPVVVSGQGVLYTGATPQLVAFAELMNMPVVTHLSGKSGFPEDHLLAGGTAAYSSSGPARFLLEEADLVVAVGASLSRSLAHGVLPPAKRIVQVGIEPQDANKEYAAEAIVVGDASLVLQQMADQVRADGGADGESELAKSLPEVRRSWLREWEPKLTSDEVPINPYRVIQTLQDTLDNRQLMVTHDAGNPRDQVVPFYCATRPRGYLGWGRSTQLGAGLGLTMGAGLADTSRTAVYICGDAAFGMCGMDVETAARERIGIIVLLLNNGAMGGYEKSMPIATEKYRSKYLTGDYSGVARALGAYSEKVVNPAEIQGALFRAREKSAAGQPVLLELITREEQDMPYLTNPWEADTSPAPALAKEEVRPRR
jgi:thiamine pyrophosphate-dependent acetolactate synthase large subunit-like protein